MTCFHVAPTDARTNTQTSTCTRARARAHTHTHSVSDRPRSQSQVHAAMSRLRAPMVRWKKLPLRRLVRALSVPPPRRQQLEQVMRWVGPVCNDPPGSGDRPLFSGCSALPTLTPSPPPPPPTLPGIS